MLKISKNVGTCFCCNRIFTNKDMEQHLNSCVKQIICSNIKNSNIIKVFKIQIFADELFWLYIEMLATAPLEILDDFLRTIWLECCCHLSEFKINNVTCKMDRSVKELFKKGSNFSYEYDFGSTTYLKGKVIDCYQGSLEKNIRLLARNNMPTLKCSTCLATSTAICSVCTVLCCKKCVKRHGCDEEVILSVANSPRIGVCGYDGMEDEDDLQQFLP